MLNQAVFLVGGLGKRLGSLTHSMPKPLVEVMGQPFLDILIEEAARHGFDDILLLSGYLGDQFLDRYNQKKVRGAHIRVVVEPKPLGTGGALRFAMPHLQPKFLLANGDTFFNINLRALAAEVPTDGGVMALCNRMEGTRYGRVGVEDRLVTGFYAPIERDYGPINGGIYALDRSVVSRVGEGVVSLETAIFPVLAKEGLLAARTFDSYFIDIGVPDDLERARRELPGRMIRPALFLDRDGVLNRDTGYVHKISEFRWNDSARETIRLANDKGWLVFVVTNQAGVARGFYGEAAVRALHAFMQDDLAEAGAHIDAFEYCPHHPEGTVAEYRKACDRRKPGPGMIRDLLEAWPVDKARSILIGDKPHDMAAAQAAGIQGHQFAGGNLLDFTARLLR